MNNLQADEVLIRGSKTDLFNLGTIRNLFASSAESVCPVLPRHISKQYLSQ